MANEFDGIREKLKRADENIRNLKSEINAFINNGKYPTLPHHEDKMWQEAVDYHRSKAIPLRFGVLAGEIIHQLRSSLDHITWIFSDDHKRINDPNGIEFPVFEVRPRDKNELRRYERKIQGITNRKALRFIAALQPYRAGTNATDQFICIIHDMDRFDKHRELAIVDSSVDITFTLPPELSELRQAIVKHQQGEPLDVFDRVLIGKAIKNYANVTPGIAFRQVGKRGSQPVIPMLEQLSNFVRTLVDRFEGIYQ